MAKKDIVVLEKSLRGAIAKYAVSQSPYACPDGLENVLRHVRERFRDDKRLERVMGTRVLLLRDRLALKDFLEDLLFDLPEVIAWNTPKVGDAKIGVVSAYDDEDSRDADRDFIDLYALVQNVGAELSENLR